MAKYRRARAATRTVYRKAKRGYSARKGLLSGNLKNVAIGAAAGFVSPMIPQFIGKWTNPAAFFAAGYILKKPALMSVAGYEIGRAFSGGFGGGESTAGGFE